MNYKKAIIYGLLSWILIYAITLILNPLFSADNIPYINITIPISIILVVSIFGVAYIRSIRSHEIIEGFKLGIVFFLIDLICDNIFLHISNIPDPIIENYPIHILSMLVMIVLITTFIGYLAQMEIELR